MRLLTNVASTVSANSVTVVLSVGTSIFLTRLLGLDGKGEFAIFIASSGLFGLVLSLGLELSMTFFTAKNCIRREALLPSIVVYASLSALLFFLLVRFNDRLLRSEFFLPVSKQTISYELLLSVLLFSLSLSGNLRAVLLGCHRFHVVNGLTVCFVLVPLLVYVTLYRLEGQGLVGLSAGELMGVHTGLSVVNSLVLLLVAARSQGLGWTWTLIDGSTVRQMFRYGFQAYIATLLQFLNYRLDFWVVAYFTGFTSLGLYSLAANLGQMLWMLPKSAATVLFPAVAAGRGENRPRDVARVGRIVLFLTTVGALLGVVLSEPVIRVMYGQDFAGAAAPFKISLLGIVPFSVCIVYASVLAGMGRQRTNLAASAIGLAVTGLLDVCLIPRFGIVGAAWASACSYLATTAWVVVRYHRISGIPLIEMIVPNPNDLGVLRDASTRLLR